MNLDEFQMNRLETHFGENATEELRRRREEQKLTMKGAYEWIISRLKAIAEEAEDEGEANGIAAGGMLIGDDEWCYAEMMFYFSKCNEGDTFKSAREIAAEEQRQKEEAERRHAKAMKLWARHKKRIVEWAGLTPEEVRHYIDLEKHPWKAREEQDEEKRLAAMTAEERKTYEKAKAKRLAEEAERKRIQEEKEAERKRKEAEREAKKRMTEEKRKREEAAAAAQMTFF